MSCLTSCFQKWISTWQNECNHTMFLLIGQLEKDWIEEVSFSEWLTLQGLCYIKFSQAPKHNHSLREWTRKSEKVNHWGKDARIWWKKVQEKYTGILWHQFLPSVWQTPTEEVIHFLIIMSKFLCLSETYAEHKDSWQLAATYSLHIAQLHCTADVQMRKLKDGSWRE